MEHRQARKASPDKVPKKKRSLIPASSKKYKTKNVWLNVLPDDLWLKVREGETVSGALQRTDQAIEGDCGSLGKCGKCKIKVLSAIGPPTREEEALLDEEELALGIRLACRTRIDKDLVISTEEADTGAEYVQILKTGIRPIMHPWPLVNKRLITLPGELEEEGLSALDRIKLVMVPDYQDLRASLNCLRNLPQMLEKTQNSGVAVLHENSLLAWQEREQFNSHCGLVFDLGTSTLVGKLINLLDGNEIAVVSTLNSQIKYGTNVISRLQYVRERPEGLENCRDLLVRDLNRITSRLLRAGGLKREDIFIAVAAGNTTMQHFLLGLDPSGIAEAPFAPVLTDGLIVKSSDVGLRLQSEALFYVMPTRSGYIGGDLISVILASGIAEQEDEIILGMDLGTNGEIFLGNRKRLLTCSAAAGPALEGANISDGMIASAGAIEGAVFANDALRYQVIGNISPKGICGSGLVELVALLLEHGIINSDGLILSPNEESVKELVSRVVERNGVRDFLVAGPDETFHHQPIYLTQKDVRELQLAKAAIAAGIRTLIDEMGASIEQIHRIYVAGALGNYIDPYSAVRIGLIPGFSPEIVNSLGNAASSGASMVLLSRNYWQMANELADSIEHIELSSRVDFNEYFVQNMNFPDGRAVE